MLAVVAPAAVLVYAFGERRRVRRWNEARRRWMKRHGNDPRDPIAQALLKQQQGAFSSLDDASIEATLSGKAYSLENHACVVCFGTLDVPEVGETRFEPEIITPLRRRLLGLPSWIPWRDLVLLLGLIGWVWYGYRRLGDARLLAANSAVLAVWILSRLLFLLRPTYYRLAPGMIQVISYRWWGGEPNVRNYPMDAGTLAIVSEVRQHGGFVLRLRRGEQADTLSIVRKRGTDALVDRIWHALLSTAPTPPLSDEELVG